jgi:hypothetical protein
MNVLDLDVYMDVMCVGFIIPAVCWLYCFLKKI